MNEDVAKKWVEALRSGKYRQGKGRLRQTDHTNHGRYCCLGVLCDIAEKEGKFKWKDWIDAQNVYVSHMTLQPDFMATASLPPEVARWAGVLPHCQATQDLAEFNDSEDSHFHGIADYIEGNADTLGDE